MTGVKEAYDDIPNQRSAPTHYILTRLANSLVTQIQNRLSFNNGRDKLLQDFSQERRSGLVFGQSIAAELFLLDVSGSGGTGSSVGSRFGLFEVELRGRHDKVYV